MNEDLFGKILVGVLILGIIATIVFWFSLAVWLITTPLPEAIGHFIKDVREAAK